MGRRGKRAGPPQGRDAGGDRRSNGIWRVDNDNDKTNALFEDYYKAQGILSDEEFPTMLQSLRSDLPTTFRVTGSRAHAETINDTIKETYIPTMQNVVWEGVKYDPPKQMSWYPGLLAWQISAPKRVVRKTEPFKRFQQFLVGETEVGNLSRQEAVSMIPPLLLDVQPHHKCLDMCAAPGSKTAQIIESLNPHHTASTGILIANDSDFKRTHMLVHQTGRMPSKGLIVTNLDAAFFPTVELKNGKKLQFDRILADVPCSGDATLRKNLEIWKRWSANDGNSLHSLQLRILERGMRMLRPGGRLVYSTCSFNPIENEAVVAAAMAAHPGQYTLVDVSADLPLLKRRPGLTTWKVATQQPASAENRFTWHESHEAYTKLAEAVSDKEKEKGRAMPASMWPPANVAELNLERALRLMPHDQDTGGFFVCVLQKAGGAESEEPATELPPVPALEEVAVADESGSTSLKRGASPSAVEGEESTKRARADASEAPTPAKAGPSKEKKKFKRDLSYKEDPYSFVDPAHAEVQSIKDWFQFGEDFETDKFLVRNDYGDPVRTIYLANETVKQIIENNDYSRLRIVSAGVKGFVKQDSTGRGEMKCKWRLPGEAISEIVPSIPESLIRHASLKELRILVGEMYPPITRFSSEIQSWMEPAYLGNMIVRFAAEKSEQGHLALPLYLPVWKAKTSMSLLIDKKEKSVLSLRLFGEDLCPAFSHLKRDDKKADKVEGAVADEEAELNSAVDTTTVKAEEGDDKGAIAASEEVAVKEQVAVNEEA